MTELTVALVDDDADFRTATAQTIRLAGLTVETFADAASLLEVVGTDFAGIVVSDIRMPRVSGLDLFDRLRAVDEAIPVILITGHGDIDMAVNAVQAGAYDFIAKPVSAQRLVQSIRRAMDMRQLVLENRDLARRLETDDGAPLLGQTPAMERLRRTLRQIAVADIDVLVEGETGSGKEVVARALHEWGRRSAAEFVALNCGALPETVIESELFGHEPGAFTGATARRIGRIEHSSGGTLFLDEIESMPLATQVKLLRVLEQRRISPLGTNKERDLDLRVIAASKLDLNQASRDGKFREDLYYRLNVVSVSIPPLRERRDDILLLFAHFLARAAKRFQVETPLVSPILRDFLVSHDWPGNVRELGHFAERFVLGLEVDATGGQVLPPASLPDRVAQAEAAILRETTERHDWNIAACLAELGIPRKTFYDKLKRHGISRAERAQ
ncbi:MAG: sigma-54 dependent transcriptional regulator [Candidatus Devosia phytovorans]|uniref:Sigma-54 dependent transcriptional regulator n=1 Tax=Candidatus Devosia phytovorans TaxID=3121372 RepID=A0AAJ5VWY9_9HYPH|nr:sigma-54 dependent transcriptional regulator [Devosia sp.]WEK06448.1 MAG: sigma-54 dependent transcriptional regulator [Devosia sp.]